MGISCWKNQQHLVDLVWGNVTETLYSLLDAEGGQLCNVARYEATEAWKETVSFPGFDDGEKYPGQGVTGSDVPF